MGTDSPSTEPGSIEALIALLRTMQCEPASFDVYMVASAAERAADALQRLRALREVQQFDHENLRAPEPSEIQVLRQQVRIERARFDSAIKHLCAITAMLRPNDIRLPDGRVMEFSPPADKVQDYWRGLTEAIRVARDHVDSTSPEPAGKLDRGRLWSFLRDCINQGTYIERDAQAGRYKSAEEVFRRLDEAAREREAEFDERCFTPTKGANDES